MLLMKLSKFWISKNGQIPAVKINIFQILNIGEIFGQKINGSFSDLLPLKIPNCLKFHNRSKQINGVVQFVLTKRCSVESGTVDVKFNIILNGLK